MTPGTSPGVWLLDLDTGGEVLRIGSEACVVTSSTAGADVKYRAGLPPIDAEIETDEIPLRIRADLWRDATRVGPLTGRSAKLRYYRGEAFLEHAIMVVSGYVAAPVVSPPDAPDAVDLTIRRGDQRSDDVCDPRAVVTADTTTAGYAPNLAGQAYPIVIGAPGRGTTDSSSSNPGPATPGLIIDPGGALGTILIALGHVPATSVQVWDLSIWGSSSSTDEIPVTHTTDLLGRKITTARIMDGVSGTLSPDANAAIGVGWHVRSGFGRGLAHRGRDVVGLGDVLAWGADTYAGDEVYDHGEIEARRSALNRYQIDTVINELGLPWDEWVEANLAEVFQIEAVTGPLGLYWREVAWTVDARSVAAVLVCDRSAPGEHVVRESGLAEVAVGDITRELTIAYAPSLLSGAMGRRVTYGAEQGDRVWQDGELRYAAHDLLARAALNRGSVSRTIEAPNVWDPSTAELLAQTHVARLALPHTALSVSGGARLLDLPAYATVRVIDARVGLDALAVLLPRPQVAASGRVTRALRIPPV